MNFTLLVQLGFVTFAVLLVARFSISTKQSNWYQVPVVLAAWALPLYYAGHVDFMQGALVFFVGIVGTLAAFSVNETLLRRVISAPAKFLLTQWLVILGVAEMANAFNFTYGLARIPDATRLYIEICGLSVLTILLWRSMLSKWAMLAFFGLLLVTSQHFVGLLLTFAVVWVPLMAAANEVGLQERPGWRHIIIILFYASPATALYTFTMISERQTAPLFLLAGLSMSAIAGWAFMQVYHRRATISPSNARA
jgi:hypothetical protein